MTDEHEHAMKVAEQAYSAGNLVTCDGYYEFDLDAAAAVIAADRAGLVAEVERLLGVVDALLQHDASSFWGVDAEKNRRASYRGVVRKAKKARAALKDTRHD